MPQQKQQMKKLPHLQTHIHQNSCRNFKSCSLQNQFGAGMLHSFVWQLSSSYMQGWICGQRGERQQDKRWYWWGSNLQPGVWCEMTPQFLLISFGSLLCLQSFVIPYPGRRTKLMVQVFCMSFVGFKPAVCVYFRATVKISEDQPSQDRSKRPLACLNDRAPKKRKLPSASQVVIEQTSCSFDSFACNPWKVEERTVSGESGDFWHVYHTPAKR